MSIATEIQRIQQAKTDIKTAIEAKGVTVADTDKIDTYASKVDEIAVGGGDDHYNTFWDGYIPTESINGDYLFAGVGWNDNTFLPNKNIKPTSANSMFYNAKITDLVIALEKAGKAIDFSSCNNFQMLIYGSRIKHIGIVDMTSVSSSANANSVFRGGGGHHLQKIDKIIVNEQYPLAANAFGNCINLTDLDIEGTITGTFIITNASKLSVQSAKNVITHLADYAGTDKEATQSAKFHENVWSALEADSTSPNGGTWVDYVISLGWNT